MKLQPDKSDAPTITSYGPGWIAVDGERIEHSVVISSKGLRIDWHCHSFSELTPAHFSMLANMDPELVIFGSGNRIHFPSAAWLSPLMSRRLGIETMDTGAACRTYNILSSEGRLVVVALLIENTPD